MVYKLETQIEISKKAIEMEKERIKNWEKDLELKKKRAEGRIKVMENKIRIIKDRFDNKESKKEESVVKKSKCLGCGTEIKYGARFCFECRKMGQRIEYQKQRDSWDTLSEKEKLKRMENLSKNLLYQEEKYCETNQKGGELK